jgi:hypothetical protein
MWELIQTRRGKEMIVARGDMGLMRKVMKQLRDSHRGGIGQHKDRVVYAIRRADSGGKPFRQKPDTRHSNRGATGPARVPKRK